MPIEMPTIGKHQALVQMGMGVAIVPRMCVQWEIERSWMKEVKVRQLSLPAPRVSGFAARSAPAACGRGADAHPARRRITGLDLGAECARHNFFGMLQP